MSKATIRIPTPLRSFTGGASEVTVEGATVGEALHALEQRHEGILELVLDRAGAVRGFVNIYVGEQNVSVLGGLRAPLTDLAVISIVPAVAGGGSARQRRIAELKAEIPEVTPAEAHALQRQGAVLVDVREPDEIAQGSPVRRPCRARDEHRKRRPRRQGDHAGRHPGRPHADGLEPRRGEQPQPAGPRRARHEDRLRA